MNNFAVKFLYYFLIRVRIVPRVTCAFPRAINITSSIKHPGNNLKPQPSELRSYLSELWAWACGAGDVTLSVLVTILFRAGDGHSFGLFSRSNYGRYLPDEHVQLCILGCESGSERIQNFARSGFMSWTV